MGIPIPSDSIKFRVAVLPGFLFIFVVGVIGQFFMVLVEDGFHFNGYAAGIAIGFALIFSLGWSWACSFVFPIAFSADGIYGYSFWGRRRFVRWQDIGAARVFRLVNLRWLRVYDSAGGKITWLALFPARDTDFKKEIRRLAPPDSPVLSYIG